MNLNQEYYKQCEIFSQEKGFTSGQIFNKFHNVVAQSTTERGNSNILQLANKSTPNNRAIFVCSTRAPKERLNMACSSMVACNGKGFALCYVPIVVVFHPVTRYRPNRGKFSGSLQKLQLELSAMIYLFKAVSRLDLRNTSKPISSFPCYTVRIQANSLEQAKAKVCPFFAVKEVVYA